MLRICDVTDAVLTGMVATVVVNSGGLVVAGGTLIWLTALEHQSFVGIFCLSWRRDYDRGGTRNSSINSRHWRAGNQWRILIGVDRLTDAEYINAWMTSPTC